MRSRALLIGVLLLTGPYAGADSGGPDSYGYRYLDSNEVDGPIYSWVDISSSGDLLSLNDLDQTVSGPIDLGFSFEYYGEYYSSVWVAKDGFLTIGIDPGPLSPWPDCPLPQEVDPANLVRVFFASLFIEPVDPALEQGNVYTQSFDIGDCPFPAYNGACWVAQWQEMSDVFSVYSFEIILFDDNSLLMQYADNNYDLYTNFAIGIANQDLTDGLTYVCKSAFAPEPTPVDLGDQLAIRFFISPFRLVAADYTLDACPGQTATYELTVTNLTRTFHTLNVAVEGFDWPVEAPSSLGELAPRTSVSFDLVHRVPVAAYSCDADSGDVIVSARIDPSLKGLRNLTTTSTCGLAWVPVGLVPGVARDEGAAGSYFKSSLWITNPYDEAITLRLRWVPAVGFGDGGGHRCSKQLELAPGKSLAFGDVLQEAFVALLPTQGVIVIEVDGESQAPLVAARTYNDTENGTYGQYIQLVPIPEVESSEQWLCGLDGAPSWRTNVGVVNLSDTETAQVVTSAYDRLGQNRNTPNVEVPPHSMVQINRINRHVEGSAQLPFRVWLSGWQKYFAYASKINEITSDPVFVPSSLGLSSHQWIDGVAAAPGELGTLFRTELTLANLGETAATVTISFTRRTFTQVTATTQLTLQPRESRVITDVLTELFGITNGVGFLEVTTATATPIVAWARTYNDRGTEGTFGQFIPRFTRFGLIGDDGAVFQGVSENNAFRSNMGMINVGDEEVVAEVTAWDQAGTRRGLRRYPVKPGQAIFASKILERMGAGGLSDGYLKIVPSLSESLYAWISSADNLSSDQTFVRPQRVSSRGTSRSLAGEWSGTTSLGESISFRLTEDGTVEDLELDININVGQNDCVRTFEIGEAVLLNDGRFEGEADISGSSLDTIVRGTIHHNETVTGTFTGYRGTFTVTCRSTRYSMINWRAFGRGTFEASRVR